MLKAADALQEAGYQVRVVHAEFSDWADEAAPLITAARGWRSELVRWRRRTAPVRYWFSRLRHKVFRLTTCLGSRFLSLGCWARAACRIAPELVRAAVREPADLIYAGTAGGLAVGFLAARRLGIPYALDMEDFHSQEREGDCRAHRVMQTVEARVLPGAAFLTASSHPIAEAYAEKYRVHPVPVNNTFPLPSTPPLFDERKARPLRLVWFSQRIGPQRGLEDGVQAAARLGRPVRLRLIGDANPAYTAQLVSLVNGADVELELLPPCGPDELLRACRENDVGLALEPGFSRNNDIALSNKLLTYMLGGLAVAATATRGQLVPAADLGPGALYYRPGDVNALAAGLKRWAEDSAELVHARRASWEAAKRRWHWEHPLERGALLNAVAQAIGKP
jgi:glycosyltransferase involved in cell wall biosynthesis